MHGMCVRVGNCAVLHKYEVVIIMDWLSFFPFEKVGGVHYHIQYDQKKSISA